MDASPEMREAIYLREIVCRNARREVPPHAFCRLNATVTGGEFIRVL